MLGLFEEFTNHADTIQPHLSYLHHAAVVHMQASNAALNVSGQNAPFEFGLWGHVAKTAPESRA